MSDTTQPDATQPTPEDDTEGSILRHPKAQVEDETAVEDDTQGHIARGHGK